MLAAHHDQENRYALQANAPKQQLQAKTPGARYPKTPLKVPLNDENAARVFNGKGVLQGKGNNENTITLGKGANGLGKTGKLAAVTPAAPQTVRAPLGNKTTNAKARNAYQTPGVKPVARDVEKTAVRPSSNRRLKQAAPHLEGPKLEVHADKKPLDDEVEYAPPKPNDLPYESDVFPDGVLTFDGLKPENLFKGYYQYYFNRVGDDGKTAVEREMEERQKKSFERGEEQILRDMDDFDWSIGDIPESKDVFKKKTVTPSTKAATTKLAMRPLSKPASTIASRKAAAALSLSAKSTNTNSATITSVTKPTTKSFLLPKRTTSQPVTQQSMLTSRDRAPTIAASRSTLGYAKGRSASSAVHSRTASTSSSGSTTNRPLSRQTGTIAAAKPRTLARSASVASSASTGSDTITPARLAQQAPSKEVKKQPDFLAILDGDDAEDDDDGLLGGGPVVDDEEDGEFELKLEF
ncbi:hypothetical protein VTJ04DRAFT_2772 [Mycothermus thermophilus]|uniref:uncharacterized protein n=1 Tax=Humicola insolens TaxID=85995 RepID=UPI0037437843